jgi:NitT/TauT family transport system permease protein
LIWPFRRTEREKEEPSGLDPISLEALPESEVGEGSEREEAFPPSGEVAEAAGPSDAPIQRVPPERRFLRLDVREQASPLMRKALGALGIAVVVLVWWLITLGETPESRLISPVLLPSPLEVVQSFPALLERDLVQSVLATLQRVFFGFGLAVLVGVPLGILAGSWRVFDAASAPLAVLGRNIPIAALIPLTVVWFGIDETQKVMFIFIACVPFVFSDAVVAVNGVQERYVDTARTLGASDGQVVRKVLMPLALPTIYNSVRNLFGLAFGYIMLAELINAGHGLGYLISMSQRRGLLEHIFLILILIGILAFAIDRFLHWFQRGLFPYRTGED